MKTMAKMSAAPVKEKRVRNAAPDDTSLTQPPVNLMEMIAPVSRMPKQ